MYRIFVVIVIILINVYTVYSDTEAVNPYYNVWTQTDWSGGAGLNVVSDSSNVTGYYDSETVLTPIGEIGLGVTVENMTLEEFGVVDIRDITLDMSVNWYLIAANEPGGGANRCKVYWMDAIEPYPVIHTAQDFPTVGGDYPVQINCIETTYDYYAFAGVEMSGGYAGVYTTIVHPTDGMIYPWTYIGGPGDPADTIPTTTCTDIYSVYGNSDNLMVATGDSGYIFHYDGTSFSPIHLSGAERIHRFDALEPYYIIALTGPNGNYYTAPKFDPTDETYWNYQTQSIPSSHLYDVITVDTYFYVATGGPAVVYRQSHTEEDLTASGELPGEPDAVYSVGRLGNMVIAGSGPDGLIYGSRNTGDSWATAVDLGDDTDINTIFIMGGAFSPHVAHACANGSNGGLHRLRSAGSCSLESAALDIGAEDSVFGKIYWDVDKNNGQYNVKVRTFNKSDFSDADEWNENTICSASDSELEELSSVTRGDKFLQYRIELEPSVDTRESPIFKEIRLEYGSLNYDSLLPDEEVTIYPNPIKGNECKIYYTVSAPAVVTVKVFDTKGRLIKSVTGEGEGLISGQYLSWNTEDVASGIYVVHVSAQNEAGTIDAVVKKAAVVK